MASTSEIPNVDLPIFSKGTWSKINTHEIASKKTIIIFSLPGAFTPTCSNSHLPGYESFYKEFKKRGIDEVYCMSVNDCFVMEAWAKAQQIQNVKILPDGNGEFNGALGTLVDKHQIGFGMRSWRYSMLIKDCKIVQMLQEPKDTNEPDPFHVSDALTMMKTIDGNFKAPPKIAMITKEGCPYCAKAKAMLDQKELHYEAIPLGDSVRGYVLAAMANADTAPAVFIDGKYIGGSTDLEKFLSKM